MKYTIKQLPENYFAVCVGDKKLTLPLSEADARRVAAALMLEKMTDEQRAKVPGFVRRDSLLHPDVLAEARAEFSKPLKRAKK